MVIIPLLVMLGLIFLLCTLATETPVGGFIGVLVFLGVLAGLGVIGQSSETPVSKTSTETVSEPINAGELDDYRIVTVDTEFGSFTFRGEPELKDSGLCILTGETSKCFNPDEWIEVHISPAIER